MSNKLYWIWAQERLGAGANTEKLLSGYASIKAFYEEENYPSHISKLRREKLKDKSLESTRKIVSHCEKRGYKILTPDDSEYPDMLRDIPDYPCALYVQGEFDFNSSPLIAVVGARKVSNYGNNVTVRLAYSLASAGMTVISGGAIGTDSAAHKGALMAGGKTVMVLGCGLDGGYLKSNEQLRQATVQSGAVISEFPPHQKASRQTFPIRNRIIAALALGTVVVQAGIKSGSLITAKFAKQYGRDVFGVPGGIYNSEFQGVNELIRDGAGIVIGVEDILYNYVKAYPDLIDLQKALAYDIKENEQIYEDLPKTKIKAVDDEIETDFSEKKRFEGLSAKAKLVYDSLEFGPKHINEISALTSLSHSEVLSHLTSLELMDAVVALEGRIYKQS